MPPKDFFTNPDAIFIRPVDISEWSVLPALSEPTATVAFDPGVDIMPSNLDLSFTATCSDEFPRNLLFPRTKLPRKMKKAATTLYFARRGRFLTIKVNHTPKTKWQRIIARKCGVGRIMTPKGQILEFEIQKWGYKLRKTIIYDS